MIDFNVAVGRVISHEGEYSNDPNDPGRETKFGISKRAYPNLDVKNLTREQAIEIYYNDYWRPLKDLAINDYVRFHLFDYAVNSGVNQAIKTYLKIYLRGKNDLHVVMLLTTERLKFLKTLPSWRNFGGGWIQRLLRNIQYAVDDLE